MSIKRGMDKKDVIHIYNEIIKRKIKESLKRNAIAATWRELEIVILNEVRERQYHMTSLICGI